MPNMKLTIAGKVRRRESVKTMADRLRWIRENNHKMTQREMAKLLKTSRSNYANKERGRQSITEEQAAILCLKLKINLNWLFTNKGSPRRNG